MIRKFSAVADAMMAQMKMVMFMNNLAMLGRALRNRIER